jgi:hypothetical protein
MENGFQPLPLPEKEKRSVLKKLLRFFFFILLGLILLLFGALTLVFIYEDEVKEAVISELNKNLSAEVRVSPENIDLTFIKTFPDCAIEFREITCMEAVKSKKRDTLFFTESLQLKFSISDLWDKTYTIKKISVSKGFAHFKINSKGMPNYTIWKESPAKSANASEALAFSLELIELQNMRVLYRNLQYKQRIAAEIKTVSFSGSFREQHYTMQSKGDLMISELMSDDVVYVSNRPLVYESKLEVNGNEYHFSNSRFVLSKLEATAQGKFVYSNKLEQLSLSFEGNELNIQSVLSLLPMKYRSRMNDYESSGKFFVSGSVKYNGHFSSFVKFGIKQSEVTYMPLKTTLTRLNTNGYLMISSDSTYLELSDFSAALMGDKVNMKLQLHRFNDPYMHLEAKGTMNLANLNKFWPIDTLAALRGMFNFETSVSANISELRRNTFRSEAAVDLKADVKQLMFRFKGSDDSTTIHSCEISSHNREVEVKHLEITRRKSDIAINGKITGAFNYLMDPLSALSISGSVKSKTLFLEDFIFSSPSASITAGKQELQLPENLHLYADAAIETFSFGKFSATQVSGNIELKNRKLFAENISLVTMKGTAMVDVLMDVSGQNAEVSVHGKLNDINVNQLFTQLNNFNQQTLVDKNIDGVLTATVDFNGTWNKFLEPDLNSMTAITDLKIVQGKLISFKPLESLSKFVDIQDLKSIRFSDMSSHVEIRKGVINIPKTSIRNSALNIDVWGTHTFNNEIDYHIQLLISELLSKKRRQSEDEFGPVQNDPENRRSAFVLMTGTVDNPVIKYDRSGLKQKIREDIKQEKQNLKQILKEEFGLFKKDSIKTKEIKKSDQSFKLETESNPKKKKNEDEDDDF